MRWAQQHRLAFIGHRLLASGTVNRRDLMRKFGISQPQASVDLRRFDEAHPGAMRYDKTRKTYVPRNLTTPAARDTTAAADMLMRADDAGLADIVRHDPSMIRDVAAALIHERDYLG